MRLTDYPVPARNTKLGWHWFPAPADVYSEAKTRDELAEQKRYGASWIKMMGAPGGDTDWTPGRPGSAEMTFWIANELGLRVVMRPYGGSHWPFWTNDIEVLCKNLKRIAGGIPFYIEPPGNEIDAEFGGVIHQDDAEALMRASADFIDGVWRVGGDSGLIIPMFPSVGYGGTGYNWFEVMHKINRGECLDRCAINIHNYLGQWPIDWPWNPILTRPILMTDEDYHAYDMEWHWHWGAADRCTLEMVNVARLAAWEQRKKLTTTEDLLRSYAEGWFTHQWCRHQLLELGHDQTPLICAEWGTRVGEKKWDGLPVVDFHMLTERTLAAIDEAQATDYILSAAGLWLWDGRGAVQYNWKDQAMKSEIYDPTVNVNMPTLWRNQIITPGRQPLLDYLEKHPITVKGETPTVKSKLGPHIQILTEPTMQAIKSIQPAIVKIMDPRPEQLIDIRKASPNSIIVARAFSESQDFTTLPADRGKEWAWRYSPIAHLIDVAEVYNEPFGNLPLNPTPEQVALYKAMLADFDTYQAAFACELWKINPLVKVGLFCLPTGNLGGAGEAQLNPTWFPKTFALPKNKVYICTHEYTWFDLDYQWGWRLGRFNLLMDWAAPNGYQLLITEMGFTQRVLEDHPDWGWRSGASDGLNHETVSEMFHDYDVRVNLYPWIKGVAIFMIGPSNGWDTHESLAEWVEAVRRTTGEEIPMPPMPLPPTPTPEPPPILISAGAYGVTIQKANVQPGEEYYQLVEVEHFSPQKNNGMHNLFLDVQDAQGKRIRGARFAVGNIDGSIVYPVVDKPDNEPGTNYVLWPKDVVWAEVADGKSDRLVGVHTQHPDEDVEHPTEWGHPGNTVSHHSFYGRWKKAIAGVAAPPVVVIPPVVTTPSDLRVREVMWNALGITFNDEAALARHAREHGLGSPRTNEIDEGDTRCQGFTAKILRCPIGRWDKITEVDW